MEDIEIAYYARSHDIFSLLSPYQIPAHRFPNIAEHFRQWDDIHYASECLAILPDCKQYLSQKLLFNG